VLFWGILGALVFRGLFVFLGVRALERYQWVVFLFSGLLVWAAIRILRHDPLLHRESRAVQFLSRHLPVSPGNPPHRFVIKENGKWMATRLLIALIAIELTDLVFAIDSVPAALSITRDRFLVYSSNAFAVLGLRSLYMVLEHSLERMRYLRFGLAVVLLFAAFKLATSEWIEIPPLLSVGIIAAAIGAAVVFSLRRGGTAHAHS
jgi:tellurite resistance protein TerC